MHRVVLGIDPGTTRQGATLVNPETLDLFAWATFESGSAYTSFPHGARIQSLTEQTDSWVSDAMLDPTGALCQLDEFVLILAIETPILNTNPRQRNNPATFGLQWRNVQSLISTIPWDVCVEVHNTAVKQALTGDGKAPKAAIIAKSPFADMPMPKIDKEALADAYSVAVAAINGAGTNIVYSSEQDPLACREGPCVAGP